MWDQSVMRSDWTTSTAMLDVARQRAAEAGAHAEFQVGDAQSLALADGEMDVGRSERMLQGEPGPEGALAESDLTWCASSGHAAVWS